VEFNLAPIRENILPNSEVCMVCRFRFLLEVKHDVPLWLLCTSFLKVLVCYTMNRSVKNTLLSEHNNKFTSISQKKQLFFVITLLVNNCQHIGQKLCH